jgi:hypothetical protein
MKLSGTNTSTLFTAIAGGALAGSGVINTTNIVVVSNLAKLDLSGVITDSRVPVNAGAMLTFIDAVGGGQFFYRTFIAP